MTLNEKFDTYMEIDELLCRDMHDRERAIALYYSKFDAQQRLQELEQKRDEILDQMDSVNITIDKLSTEISDTLHKLSQKKQGI